MYEKNRKRIQFFFLGIQLLLFALIISGTLDIVSILFPASHLKGIPGFLLLLFHPVTMIIGLLISFIAIFFGRWFCSHVCMFGSIQEMLFLTRNREYRLNNKVPFYIDKKLMWLKYLILILSMGVIILGLLYRDKLLSLASMASCPMWMTISGAVAFVLLLLGSFLTERFFCRYFCAYGAFMNILEYVGAKMGLKRKLIMRNLEVCTDCRECNRRCPMNIEIMDVELVKNPNCIQCLRCIDRCPQRGALTR